MRRLAIALCLTMITGCHHGGTAPPGWQGEPISLTGFDGPNEQHANHSPGNGAHVNGRLQVFICYGRVLSNHTALRLETPGKETLFWDPGGTYKQNDPTRARTHDVLTRNAPDLEEWWRYRRDGCREPFMEVYEWSIDARQAGRMHEVLLKRQDPYDATQIFEPDAGGLQCSTRVSAILMKFAKGRPALSKPYFWPHKLGEHLWTQHPDRVWVFRAQGESLVYQQQAPSTAAE